MRRYVSCTEAQQQEVLIEFTAMLDAMALRRAAAILRDHADSYKRLAVRYKQDKNRAAAYRGLAKKLRDDYTVMFRDSANPLLH